VRDLEANSFEARQAKQPLNIRAETYDAGPRRIVFVVDRGPRVNEPARKISETALRRILQHARTIDSFALITAGQHVTRIPFGRSAEDVMAQFEKPKKPSDERLALLDALAEAANWLTPAQPGDSIYVFSGENEFRGARANLRKVYESLSKNHIRVFGLLFNYLHPLPSFFAPPETSALLVAFSQDPGDLNHLAWVTGGYCAVENTQSVEREYKLTDARLAELEQVGWRIYAAAVEYYRLQVTPAAVQQKPQSWQLDLAVNVRSRIPGAIVLYPRELPACSSNANSK